MLNLCYVRKKINKEKLNPDKDTLGSLKTTAVLLTKTFEELQRVRISSDLRSCVTGSGGKRNLILHTSGLLNKSAQTRTCLYHRDKNSCIKIIQLLTAGIVLGLSLLCWPGVRDHGSHFLRGGGCRDRSLEPGNKLIALF